MNHPKDDHLGKETDLLINIRLRSENALAQCRKQLFKGLVHTEISENSCGYLWILWELRYCVSTDILILCKLYQVLSLIHAIAVSRTSITINFRVPPLNNRFLPVRSIHMHITQGNP